MPNLIVEPMTDRNRITFQRPLFDILLVTAARNLLTDALFVTCCKRNCIGNGGMRGGGEIVVKQRNVERMKSNMVV